MILSSTFDDGRGTDSTGRDSDQTNYPDCFTHAVVNVRSCEFPRSVLQADTIKAAGNTELCEIVDVEPKSQCRACPTYWNVGIVYCTCGHFLRDDAELQHQEGPATRSQVREERRLQRIPHGKTTPKEVSKETI